MRSDGRGSEAPSGSLSTLIGTLGRAALVGRRRLGGGLLGGGLLGGSLLLRLGGGFGGTRLGGGGIAGSRARLLRRPLGALGALRLLLQVVLRALPQPLVPA